MAQDKNLPPPRPWDAQPNVFIVRQWRGDLPLPVSFWGIGLSGLLIERGLDKTASLLLPQAFDPYFATAILLTAYGSQAIFLVWWWVGTWRAATWYRIRDELQGPWLSLVTFTICLSILKTAYVFWGYAIPQISDSISDVLEDPQLGSRGIKVVGPNELEMYGQITRSASKALSEALVSNPAVSTLSLESLGGRIVPALDIAAIVRKRGLDTIVRTECDSACTIVFLAGAHHCITQYARLGFQRASYAGEAAALANQRVREEMQEAGVLPSFIDRALSTSPDSVWYPALDELNSARVLTCVAPDPTR